MEIEIQDDYMVDEDTPEDVFSERSELIRALKNKEVILSHSSFNAFCDSPRHFMDYKLREFKPTPSMKFGTMVHCSILEPAEFENRYYVLPENDQRPEQEKNMNSKINQLWKAEQIALAGGRTVVERKDYDTAQRIGDSIRKSDVASTLLEKCHNFETPIEWEYGGFQWRGKNGRRRQKKRGDNGLKSFGRCFAPEGCTIREIRRGRTAGSTLLKRRECRRLRLFYFGRRTFWKLQRVPDWKGINKPT